MGWTKMKAFLSTTESSKMKFKIPNLRHRMQITDKDKVQVILIRIRIVRTIPKIMIMMMSIKERFNRVNLS